MTDNLKDITEAKVSLKPNHHRLRHGTPIPCGRTPRGIGHRPSRDRPCGPQLQDGHRAKTAAAPRRPTIRREEAPVVAQVLNRTLVASLHRGARRRMVGPSVHGAADLTKDSQPVLLQRTHQQLLCQLASHFRHNPNCRAPMLAPARCCLDRHAVSLAFLMVSAFADGAARAVRFVWTVTASIRKPSTTAWILMLSPRIVSAKRSEGVSGSYACPSRDR
jgi:hypothetical protein